MNKITIKFISLFLFLIVGCAYGVSAQGKYAGTTLKKLIGKAYNNDRELPGGIKGYEYREASLASGAEDPEQFTVAIFQKGTTYVVFFAINEDTLTDDYIILDVLEIKNVKSNQAIKTLLCRQNKISNIEIVAVTQPGNKEYSRALKAWRFNRDKRRFETMPAQNIDCMNEGDD